eukprot:7682161-Pyramimonas_sp.AAC.1
MRSSTGQCRLKRARQGPRGKGACSSCELKRTIASECDKYECECELIRTAAKTNAGSYERAQEIIQPDASEHERMRAFWGSTGQGHLEP